MDAILSNEWSSAMRRFRSACGRATGRIFIALVFVVFACDAKSDVYVTGVDDGENTTIRFSGTLILPELPPNNVSVLVPGGAALIGGSFNAESDTLRLGPLASVLADIHTGLLDTNNPLQLIRFFRGSDFNADPVSHSGDLFDITKNELRVATGYESGGPLNGETVFRGTGLPIDLTTPRTLSLIGSDSKIHFNVPAPLPRLRISAPRRTFLYRNRLVLRGTSVRPLSSLRIKMTGISGVRTRQLGGLIVWRVTVPKRILQANRSITVRVRGVDIAGNMSPVVIRKFRRR